MSLPGSSGSSRRRSSVRMSRIFLPLASVNSSGSIGTGGGLGGAGGFSFLSLRFLVGGALSVSKSPKSNSSPSSSSSSSMRPPISTPSSVKVGTRRFLRKARSTACWISSLRCASTSSEYSGRSGAPASIHLRFTSALSGAPPPASRICSARRPRLCSCLAPSAASCPTMSASRRCSSEHGTISGIAGSTTRLADAIFCFSSSSAASRRCSRILASRWPMRLRMSRAERPLRKVRAVPAMSAFTSTALTSS
mmetsp:Transcript_12081/g.37267  ORF Transcript_12081/g.37267 Transcript_12081/m.37267 type:complete len:251 (-) Transcript_12081:4388-5140(-)